MRRISLFCFFLLSVALITTAVYAQENQGDYEDSSYGFDSSDIQYANSPLNKLGRGLINTATCWAHVPGEIAEVSEETDPVIGCTLGLAKGLITGVVRGVTGMFEAITFLAPPYNQPLMRPEYALKEADDKIREYLW